MADAPKSKSEAKRLAVQRAPERLELGEPDDLSGTFVDQIAKLKAKVAALEQERNEANQACREFVELKLEQRGRAIVAEDEAARLREAIREIRDIVTRPGPVGVNGWNKVAIICDRLTEGEEGETMIGPCATVDELVERIKVQCGMSDVPEGEPEPWSGQHKAIESDFPIGSKLLIRWDFAEDWVPDDVGYLFTLPVEPSSDTGACVLIPEPYVEKEAPEPIWITLSDLLNSPYLVSVRLTEGENDGR